MFALLLLGLVAAALGVGMLARPDLAWKLTRWRNAAQGLRSERTHVWEAHNRLGAGLLVAVGIGSAAVGGVLGLEASARESRYALFDEIELSCAREGVRVVNHGRQLRFVTLSEVHATGNRLGISAADWGGRPVASSAPGKGAVRIRGRETLELPAGEAGKMSVRFPAKARCKDELLPELGGMLGGALRDGSDGCATLQLRMEVRTRAEARPEFSVWRTCRLRDPRERPDENSAAGAALE